jgi:peptide/nickel transport system substrate-binding protein
MENELSGSAGVNAPREALLHTTDQLTYLHWSLGQSNYYRTCNSVYACGSPYATTVGAAPIIEHNLVRASQLLKESGYDGTPVVVLQVTDRPFLNAAAIVTARRLEAAGFKVIPGNGLVDEPDRPSA